MTQTMHLHQAARSKLKMARVLRATRHTQCQRPREALSNQHNNKWRRPRVPGKYRASRTEARACSLKSSLRSSRTLVRTQNLQKTTLYLHSPCSIEKSKLHNSACLPFLGCPRSSIRHSNALPRSALSPFYSRSRAHCARQKRFFVSR